MKAGVKVATLRVHQHQGVNPWPGHGLPKFKNVPGPNVPCGKDGVALNLNGHRNGRAGEDDATGHGQDPGRSKKPTHHLKKYVYNVFFQIYT